MRWEVRLGTAGQIVLVLAAALLALAHGGVGGPFGGLVPFGMVILALRARPRRFLVVAAVALIAYWAVVLIGEPAPAGYAVACTLGFAGVSYLCMKHTAALASLRRRLARVSGTDPLTGALNRRGFDERLQYELAGGRPTTLVLADLDLFKQVNDVYGHQAGDQLLAAVAGRLEQGLRPGDGVGRIGGDEFAAVLPDVRPGEAAALTERLRAALADVAPASVGYACFPADGLTLDELRRVADARVYADKQSRDRRPPSAEAVAAAAHVRTGRAPRVSASERRRRSVADIGWMSMLGGGCGLLYALAFATWQPAIIVLAALLFTAGAALMAGAGPVSRFARARLVVLAAAVVEAALIGGMAALDGGVSGVCALALLVPMPLIALTSPLRVSVWVGGLFGTVYLVVAVLAGSPGGWYVAMHLGGTAVVCAACAVQGRTAGRQRRRMTELSRRDALTEILNRRGFEHRCAAELAKGGDATLVIVDLDGFKQINDRFGHEAGDDLLRWVAGTLTASLLPQDVVGRFGGDEFVALLPRNDPSVSGRLRAALAQRTGASFGTAVLGRDGDDFTALYAHADAGLYADKRATQTAAAASPTPRS
ncbi:GGDEF domain-containing protein [Actinoplanes sp. NPDC026619]|uniref:GGDEF domain-containing protein n=1 Tax=Actinoplanes sp. NPDC026619 TaxID=3155798 RepID=UPI003406E644